MPSQRPPQIAPVCGSMRLRGCPTLPAHASQVTQSGPLGPPRIFEKMPFERIEGVGRGKEAEAAAVAHDNTGLDGCGGPWCDLDDVVVRRGARGNTGRRSQHLSLPSRSELERPGERCCMS